MITAFNSQFCLICLTWQTLNYLSCKLIVLWNALRNSLDRCYSNIVWLTDRALCLLSRKYMPLFLVKKLKWYNHNSITFINNQTYLLFIIFLNLITLLSMLWNANKISRFTQRSCVFWSLHTEGYIYV